MINYWDYWNGYEAPSGGMGLATTLPDADKDRDFAAELRGAYKEATGHELDAPEKRRIGFV